MSLATLLVLADGRLPAGGHAHSGGLEAAVSSGRGRDGAGLDGFLRGRLSTAGVVAAAFAAVACGRVAKSVVGGAGSTRGTGPTALAPALLDLDAGMDARTPSPPLRRASRAQGRALLRAGRSMWPGPPIA